MDSKICAECNKVYKINEFIMYHGYRNPYCNTCRKERSKRNNDRISKLKKVKLW